MRRIRVGGGNMKPISAKSKYRPELLRFGSYGRRFPIYISFL
jgi:hypothetical protein